jgi:hypothetical protein
MLFQVVNELTNGFDGNNPKPSFVVYHSVPPYAEPRCLSS